MARTEVVAYLARRPYDNVFLQWIVEGGLGSGIALDSVVVWRAADRQIAGAAFFGPQIVIAADDVAAIDSFATEARQRPPARMIVGPRVIMNHFWARVRTWYQKPSLIRPSQPVYALESAPAPSEAAPVRKARLDELELIAANSAEMMIVELGYDPRAHRANFLQGVARLIERGWWWVWVEDGELRFQCNIGSQTPQTAQIQGVWTPPDLRGQGYAYGALSEICRHLLVEVPSISLYVNDFNTDAIDLYERIGFQRTGEFTTYLFNDD